MARKIKGRPREKGICPTCGKTCAILKGVGPDLYGRGDVIEHKGNEINDAGDRNSCLGGKAIRR